MFGFGGGFTDGGGDRGHTRSSNVFVNESNGFNGNNRISDVGNVMHMVRNAIYINEMLSTEISEESSNPEGEKEGLWAIACIFISGFIALFTYLIINAINNIDNIVQSHGMINNLKKLISMGNDAFCDEKLCTKLLENNLSYYAQTFNTGISMLVLFGFIVIAPLIYIIVTFTCLKQGDTEILRNSNNCRDCGCGCKECGCECADRNCLLFLIVFISGGTNIGLFVQCCIVFNSYIKLKDINVITFDSMSFGFKIFEFAKITHPNMTSSIVCFVVQIIVVVLLAILFTVKIVRRCSNGICTNQN
jgi:hypothetical protein